LAAFMLTIVGGSGAKTSPAEVYFDAEVCASLLVLTPDQLRRLK
jgi:hypothetical protein